MIESTAHAPVQDGLLTSRSPGFSTAVRQQVLFLWATRRPHVLLAGLITVLALAGWLPGPLTRVLSAWLVWLVVVGPVWALAVWHDEPPRRRQYLWSQPVSRSTQTLARVTAGMLWLLGAYALTLAAGAAVAVFSGQQAQLAAISGGAWLNLLSAPVLGYLAVSCLAVASDYPLRWLLGLLLVPTLVIAVVGEWLGITDSLAPLLDRIGAFSPTSAVLGPAVVDIQRVVLELTGETPRMHFTGDTSFWWLALILWTLVLAGLLELLARLHPDRLPPWRSGGWSGRHPVARWTAAGLPFIVVTTLVVQAVDAKGGGAAAGLDVAFDSAGVRVVRSSRSGAWTPGAAWTLVEDLRLGIGSGGNRPELEFGDIAGIDAGADGTIYVLDRSTSTVRVFGSDGNPVGSLGGRGRGPGELSPRAGPILLMSGDTVLVSDPALGRAVLFTKDGHAGSFPLSRAEGLPLRWMRMPDGMIVEHVVALDQSGPATERRTWHLLLLRAASGEIVDTIARREASGSRAFSGGAPTLTLFAGEPVWTVDDAGRLIGGDPRSWSLSVRDRSGLLTESWTREVPARPVTDGDRDRALGLLEAGLRRDGLPGPQIELLAKAVRFADQWPAFADVLGGPDGTVWVQRVSPPQDLHVATGAIGFDIGARTWDVFDAGGRFLGSVTTPPDFDAIAFRNDRLFGIQRDSLGVQYVLRLRVVKQ